MDRKELFKILEKNQLEYDNLKKILSIDNHILENIILKKADDIKKEIIGDKVYFRGIIEFSNICQKNCLYCGIRKDNNNVKRFLMTKENIVESAMWAFEADYGSIVLQSGERIDDEFIGFVESVLLAIKAKTDGKLGITLSLGEQSHKTYQRWYDAGAHRYLLRIETSNKKLYRSLHPEDHSFEERLNCLKILRQIGYQVGTGIMIGLPGQSTDDLVKDLIFFKENDIDMIGMGPFIPHKDTPMKSERKNFNEEKQLNLGLKMIALTRIFLRDVNIASTTALQALSPIGREMGLAAGANILMPTITETEYREYYQLYDNKPCIDENASMCRNCLKNRVEKIGLKIGFNEWGDSPHYFSRNKIDSYSQTGGKL